MPPRQGAVDESADRVQVEIRNEGDLDAVIYAYRLGQRYRLGFVTAHSTATLTLPLLQTENGETSLYVHRIGETDGQDFLSNPVQVTPGSRPVLFLNPNVRASSLAVFQGPDR